MLRKETSSDKPQPQDKISEGSKRLLNGKDFQNHFNQLPMHRIQVSDPGQDPRNTPIFQENKFSFADQSNGYRDNSQSSQHNIDSVLGNSQPREAHGSSHNDGRQDTMELIDPEDNHMNYQLLNNQDNSRNGGDNNRMGGQSDDLVHNRDHGNLKNEQNYQNSYRSQTSRLIQKEDINCSSFQFQNKQRGMQYRTSNLSTPGKTLQNIQIQKRTYSREEDNDDEPSLQSPEHQNVKKLLGHPISEEPSSIDNCGTDVQISPDISPSKEPQPEALKVMQSEKSNVYSTPVSPVDQKYVPVPTKSEYNTVLKNTLQESPVLTEKNSRIDNNNSGHNNMERQIMETKQDPRIQNQDLNDRSGEDIPPYTEAERALMTAKKAYQINTDQKHLSNGRRELDINVKDYNNMENVVGTGLLDNIGDMINQTNVPGQYSEVKPSRNGAMHSSLLLRSKSQNDRIGLSATISNVPPTEVQAHMDNMKFRSSQQFNQPGGFMKASQMSPFTNTTKNVQHIYEPNYLNRQQMISNFEAQSQFSGALRSGNPLTTSISLNQFNMTQNGLRLDNSQFDAQSQNGGLMLTHQISGLQYDAILKERAEKIDKIDELQAVIDQQRKQISELMSKQTLQKFDVNEKSDEIEDLNLKMLEKDKANNELKETIKRLTDQIEEVRMENTLCSSKEREMRMSNDSLKKKIADLDKQLNYFQKNKTQEDGDSKNLVEETSDQMQSKIKEIYTLTVELGSLREENNELNKNIELQKQDFQERLKEQRERYQDDYNKMIDDMELQKIQQQDQVLDSQRVIDDHVRKIQNQEQQIMDKIKAKDQIDESERCIMMQQQKITKLEEDIKHRDEQIKELKDDISKQKKECRDVKELNNLQKVEINQLTKNYQMLNQQLDLLSAQFGGDGSHKRWASKGSVKSIKRIKDQVISGAGQLTERSISNDGKPDVKIIDTTHQDFNATTKINKRALDQSPEIIGSKSQVRQTMIMSSQDKIESENLEDGMQAPLNMNNQELNSMISNQEDNFLTTHRNPIQTENSKYLNNENGEYLITPNDNDSDQMNEVAPQGPNFQNEQIYNDQQLNLKYINQKNHNQLHDQQQVRRVSYKQGSYNAFRRSAQIDPNYYDSLNDESKPVLVKESNMSVKGRLQHQLIVRGSQDSSENWNKPDTKSNTNRQSGDFSQPSAQSRFQTIQQTDGSFRRENDSMIQSTRQFKARSPIPQQTSYGKYNKNNISKNLIQNNKNNLKISQGRSSVQQPDINNSSHGITPQATHLSHNGENSDIGTKLLGQRRKNQGGMLQSSQSTASIINPSPYNTNLGIGMNKSMMPAPQPMGSQQNNLRNSSNNAIHARNQDSQRSGASSGLGISPGMGKGLRFPHRNKMNIQNSNQQIGMHKIQSQKVLQKSLNKSRPSMLVGGNQTKSGLTPILPKNGMSQNLEKKEMNRNLFGSTTTNNSGNQKTCLTARQFLQKSPMNSGNHTKESFVQSQANRSGSKNQFLSKLNSARRNGSDSRTGQIRDDLRKRYPTNNQSHIQKQSTMVKQKQPNDSIDQNNEQGHNFNNNRQQSMRYLQTMPNDPTSGDEDNAMQFQKDNQWLVTDCNIADNGEPQYDNFEFNDPHDPQEGDMMENGPHLVEDDMENYVYEEEQMPTGAITTRMPNTLINRVTTQNPNEMIIQAQTHRPPNEAFGSQPPEKKDHMNEMKAKLQSIQTGKAYLEKKIQEYESRLNSMKVKKDRIGKGQRMKY